MFFLITENNDHFTQANDVNMLCLQPPYHVASSGFGLVGRQWMGRDGSRTGKLFFGVFLMKSESPFLLLLSHPIQSNPTQPKRKLKAESVSNTDIYTYTHTRWWQIESEWYEMTQNETKQITSYPFISFEIGVTSNCVIHFSIVWCFTPRT